MAALSRPLASAAFDGAITFSPGTCAYHAEIALAVLGAHARRRAVGAAEHDGAAHLSAGHVQRLGGRVDDLVDGLHGEVPGHELDDRAQAGEGRADADAGEALLGDRACR